MTAGIVGLGLIGGSLAKAYHEAGEAVLAFDTDRSILDFAMMSGAVDGVLDEESIKRCDIVLIAVYPAACIEYFTRMADYISKDTVVLDCCGTKRTVCEGCFPVAKAHGIAFAGGHPMAGTHNSGFKYARANLFHGAPMVIVPMDFDNIALLSRIEKLSARYPRIRTTGCCRSLRNCGKRIPPYPVTLQTISKVLLTMILHSSCSRTVRWKMQSVWITSSTSYRLQIWFCRIRIPPLRNTRPLSCCRYPS